MGMNGLSEDPIPEGLYCYTRTSGWITPEDGGLPYFQTRTCPYWENRPGKYDAYCRFLDEEDIDGVLLWDKVKICGVKDYLDEDIEEG